MEADQRVLKPSRKKSRACVQEAVQEVGVRYEFWEYRLDDYTFWFLLAET